MNEEIEEGDDIEEQSKSSDIGKGDNKVNQANDSKVTEKKEKENSKKVKKKTTKR